MLSLSPSLEDRDAHKHLDLLVTPRVSADHCCSEIRRLNERFLVYAATCPFPLPAPSLIITPEVRRQSEFYLPLADVAPAFHRLYQESLSYSPIIESTPFHTALSWADVFGALPPRLQFSANPARLLKALRDSQELLQDFLFNSFLPRRFYGGFRRYPRQQEYVCAWLNRNSQKTVRCLDAACGTGEDSYGLALLLLEYGRQPAEFQIEGWTIEPLEIWAAAHARFPHDAEREAVYRRETDAVFARNAGDRMHFRAVDLRDSVLLSRWAEEYEPFDLILCNGLLGGPILNKPQEVQAVLSGLTGLLAPKGILLAADSFHGGWKKRHPQDWLQVQCELIGLEVSPAGEGICVCRRE